jgi:prepilin-type N-terminal cleavage/methylation domain-containing protein
MSNKKTFTPLKTSSKRRAFSLIELSIVLIIIGLLIAGITGGASLIKSASLRAAMGEARGYNVAVNSFYVQYDSLPGDSATVIAVTTASATAVSSAAGDANGRIEWVDGKAANVTEGQNAWAALKNAGIIDTVLTYNIPQSTTPFATFLPGTGAGGVIAQVAGTNYPNSKIKSSGWIFDWITANSQNVAILTGGPIAATTAVASTAAAAVPVGSITPSDGLSIDTKMDDGLPAAGKVRAHATPSACVSGGAYATSLTTTSCAMTFQIDIT